MIRIFRKKHDGINFLKKYRSKTKALQKYMMTKSIDIQMESLILKYLKRQNLSLTQENIYKNSK